MDYWFVVYDLSTQLALELHFPNNTGMSQIINICILLSTIFLSRQLLSYSLLCAFFNTRFLLKYDIYTYCTFWQICSGLIDLFLI